MQYCSTCSHSHLPNTCSAHTYPGLVEEELLVHETHGDHLVNHTVHSLSKDSAGGSGDLLQCPGGRLSLVQEGIDVQSTPGQSGPAGEKAPIHNGRGQCRAQLMGRGERTS